MIMLDKIELFFFLLENEGSFAEEEEQMWVHTLPIQTSLPEHNAQHGDLTGHYT